MSTPTIIYRPVIRTIKVSAPFRRVIKAVLPAYKAIRVGFQGPPGIQGVPGIQGGKGDKGDKGDPGTGVDSLSIVLISVVWGTPGAESGNAIEIAASCQDFQGNPFASGIVDVLIVATDAANDGEPSATATIGPAAVPVGTILTGQGTATATVRTDASGNFKIRVSETAAASRYLWIRQGGNARLWVRSATGVQQLIFS